MLSSLKIENVAVIEHSEIAFDSGLNILTGETGAGKSIVIDAINAVLGERTSRDIIRSGAEKARVTALFDSIPRELYPVLEEYDVDTDEGCLLISRIISSDGRGSCKINGCPVTVSMLRKIGRSLISICGQHDSQLLLSREHHLELVDSMAESDELLDEYKTLYFNYKQLYKKLRKLQQTETDKDRRLDLLKYQIDEISSADIKLGEKKLLDERRRYLQNKEKISRSISNAIELLKGDETSAGINSSLQYLIGLLEEIGEFSKEVEEYTSPVRDAAYMLEECTRALSGSQDEGNTQQLDINETEERLDTIYRLTKKYGGSEQAVLDFLNQAQQEYDEIFDNGATIEALEQELDSLSEELFKKGCHLSDVRKTAAIDFENRVLRELTYLDMPNACFKVSFDEAPATENGLDSVEFLFSANAGQQARPLAKIASGGELSRVMLAIRCVLSNADCIGTMIFDEIDTGVSGRAAHKIAYKMHELSHYKQVLCVTHLAQIAAYADNHLYVSKRVCDNSTYTDVLSLEEDERIKELARIIGGEIITSATLSSAKELIDYAQSEQF